MKRIQSRWLLLITLTILLLVVMLVPIPVPQSINTSGKIIPAQEWVVSKTSDGRISSVLRDNLKGRHITYFSTLFERGDAIQLKFNEHLLDSGRLSAGDTIGVILSNDLRHQMEQLRGLLEVRTRELEFYRSGEKSALIEQAQKELQAAQTEAATQQELAKRKKLLFEQNLISQESYDLEQMQADVLAQKAASARARLKSIMTGAKEEQIALIQSQIDALKKELLVYQARQRDFTLTSPISGRIIETFSADTLLLVESRGKRAVLFPVPVEQQNRLSDIEEITLRPANYRQTLPARLVRKGQLVKRINGRSVVLLTAALDETPLNLNTGLMARVNIKVKDEHLKDLIVNFIRSVTRL